MASGDRWHPRDLVRVLVILAMGGALGTGGVFVGRNGNGVTREQCVVEVQRNCLYREDRQAVRRDLLRCEAAIKELSVRVRALTRSWDAIRGPLNVLIDRQLKAGEGE